MRSKTLSSDFTILRKDLTRFAPVWLSLCAYLAIWASAIFTGGEKLGYYYEPTAPIFAPILALVIFGYLCDPTECVAVHSLPIRRERLFLIHTAASCIMFLIPTALFCFVTRNAATQGVFYRFLFTGVEFIFLFSIGVLCMMLTGRKVGAALLFLFIQLFPTILGGFIECFYLPCLPGVYLGTDYYELSPMRIVSNYADFMHETTISNAAWIFTAVITAVSVGILALSMLLYRRRKLEHAGDLLAFGWLDPFFAVCACMTGIWILSDYGYDSEWFLMILGGVIGYFAYWMLSKKTARVFTIKRIAGLLCLFAAFIGSLYLTFLDPLDRVYHVPEPENVAKVVLKEYAFSEERYMSDDPEIISEIGALHLLLAEHYTAEDLFHAYTDSETVHLTYHLKNGTTLEREYQCHDKALLQKAAWYLSQPEAVFGRDDPQFFDVDVTFRSENMYLDPLLVSELVQIILNECREGRMFQFPYSNNGWEIHFEQRDPEWTTYLYIPDCATDTLAWLREHCVYYK